MRINYAHACAQNIKHMLSPFIGHFPSLVKLKEEDVDNNILSVMSSDDKRYFVRCIISQGMKEIIAIIGVITSRDLFITTI